MTPEYAADQIYNAAVKNKRKLVLGREGKLGILLYHLLPNVFYKKMIEKFKNKIV